MLYIILYGFLAISSSVILKNSQSLKSNIAVLLLAAIIFYLMYKKYIKEFDGFNGMLLYHKNLININNVKHDNNNALTIENEQNIKPVTIDDGRFKMSNTRWIYLLFVFFMSDLFIPLLNTPAYFIFNIVNYLVLLVAMAPLVIESYHGLKQGGIKNTLKWIGLGVVLIYLFNFLYGLFLDILNVPLGDPGNQEAIVLMLNADFLKIAFEITFTAAIFEEFIFRGLAFRNLFNKSKLLAYITTFLAFGIPHLIVGFAGGSGLAEFIYLPIYGMMGVIFAFVYEKTGSIFTAMGAHFTSNLISVFAITFL